MTLQWRRILVIALFFQGAIPVIAQDGIDAPADAATAEASAETPAGDNAAGEPLPAEATGTDQAADDERVLETDDESYLDIDEKDFTPSEEIPTDQSISFPVDI